MKIKHYLKYKELMIPKMLNTISVKELHTSTKAKIRRKNTK